jgi:Ca-activated chloride channel homolog
MLLILNCKRIRLTAFYCQLLVGLMAYTVTSAQQTRVYKPRISRVLFVLDGSGSMKQKWGESSKFELARELLFKLIDSVERKNPNVEFAVRVFGYQFPNTQHDCRDSKLLLPFAKNNAAKITSALSKITPQGMSPIAFSIEQGAKDFPVDTQSLNSIVLITDGEETCGGDPCKISKELAAHRVSLKPFIVGLNVDSVSKNKYQCVGTFFDTRDKTSFYDAVGVIIRQTLNTTTAQINLLDANGDPTVTNIPFTLYDHYTHAIEYNFVHTMNEKGNPDTLYLDPVGVYDLELHTYPSIRKENIELIPGKHNIIAVDAAFGNLSVDCIASSIANNSAQVVVRPKPDSKNILNVQDLNGQTSYLSGNYKLEILTMPETFRDTAIAAFTDTKLLINNYGTLSMIVADNYLASVYSYAKGNLQMVEHFELNGKTDNRKYQPGDYRLVYKPKNNYHSQSTRSLQFTIEEGKTTVLTL